MNLALFSIYNAGTSVDRLVYATDGLLSKEARIILLKKVGEILQYSSRECLSMKCMSIDGMETSGFGASNERGTSGFGAASAAKRSRH